MGIISGQQLMKVKGFQSCKYTSKDTQLLLSYLISHIYAVLFNDTLQRSPLSQNPWLAGKSFTHAPPDTLLPGSLFSPPMPGDMGDKAAGSKEATTSQS